MILQQYYRARIREKKVWIIAGVLIFYVILIAIIGRLSKIENYSTENQLRIYYNDLMGTQALTFLVIPLYFVYSLFSQTFFLRTIVRCRFRGTYHFWRYWYTVIGIDSGIYTIFLQLMLIFRFVLAGKQAFLLGQMQSIFLSAILQFFTLFLMGGLFCALVFVLRKKILGFLILYGISLYDYMMSSFYTDGHFQVLFFLPTLSAYPYFLPLFIQKLVLLLGCLWSLFFIFWLVADHVDTLKG